MYLPLLGDVSDILLLTCLLLIGFYLYGTSYVGVWEKVGVPGPKPWPIIDHTLDLTKGFDRAFDKWHIKYGRTFGIYGFRPRTATLVTTDIRLLNHILVKDSNNFADRYVFKVTRSCMVKGLFFVNGDVWKRNRHVMSPMFTGARLKLMFHHANDTAVGLVELIKEYKAKDKLIPVKNFAARYASDVIAKSGFGLDGHAVRSGESEFFYHINRFLRLGTPLQIACLMLLLIFPCLSELVFKLLPSADAIYPEAEQYFSRLAESALERKRQEKLEGKGRSKPRDILDLMLESEVDEKRPLAGEDRGMTKEEIIGNSVLLIFAAYETTSSCLMSILYCLARHPHIQDRTLQEIDEVMKGRSQPDYEVLSELKYTEQVIMESLRMFPPSGNAQRMPLETRTYEGITIPKGTNIYIPISKILKDPEYWPDPEKFDPDRFSLDKKSDVETVAFLPFGFGPRHCIGKRLAMLELKVVLCHLLSAMKFIQSERTEPKLGHDVVMTTLGRSDFPAPEKPIILDVVLR